MVLEPEITPLDTLRAEVKQDWPSLATAKGRAETNRTVLSEMLANPLDPFGRTDECNIVVFGSTARDETTPDSDVDWTLLIDGPADPNHRDIAHEIAKRIRDSDTFKSRDHVGTFGGMAFSHDIVHQIGGRDDTNDNITRRILLLAESKPIGPSDTWERVVLSVLSRYIEDDVTISLPSTHKQYNIPRFLLNDVVRYWRTIAVDYAHKRRERAGQGWAIRNIKLRFSRKLIFVSGLLTCFSCHLRPSFTIEAPLLGNEQVRLPLTHHLLRYVKMPPLDILAEALILYAQPETAIQAIDAYDGFIGLLSDREKRGHLETLEFDKAEHDPVFNEAREMSHNFQEALTRLFYCDNEELRDLTIKYGVF